MHNIAALAKGITMLSHREPVDGRVSWVAAERGYEDYNEYIVETEEALLLIDTGVAKHQDALIAFVGERLGGRRLVVYCTRIELDSIGNLGALLDHFPVATVVTANPISPVSLVHRQGTAPIAVHHLRFGQTLEAFGFPGLRVIEPVVRTLGTSWLFDDASATLFCSDAFCSDLATRAGDSPIRKSGEAGPLAEALRAGLFAKFDWLARSDKRAMTAAWARVFDVVLPKRLAPIHGRAACGDDVIQILLAAYKDAICAPIGTA
jgi:flavorubredoxin